MRRAVELSRAVRIVANVTAAATLAVVLAANSSAAWCGAASVEAVTICGEAR